MSLPPGVVRYLVVGQAIIPFFINVAVNVVLGVLAFSGSETVPTWAIDKGAAADSVGTCFFLPFITCLIATPIVRRHVLRGTVSPVAKCDLPRWMLFFCRPSFPRAIMFGIAGLMILAGPVFVVYRVLAGETIPTVSFLVIKAVFAGVFGVFVTPLIALVAMTDSEVAAARQALPNESA